MPRDCKSSQPSVPKGKDFKDIGNRTFSIFQNPVCGKQADFTSMMVDSNGPVSADSRCHTHSSIDRRSEFCMCIFTAYPTDFSGLGTSPCHGLIDTGAQDGVVGIWDLQRWVVLYSTCSWVTTFVSTCS